jgi:hypothetical protein
MQIVITAGEAIDKGIWDDLCEMKRLNIWAVNEGLMDSDEPITLSEEEAKKLGLL